MRQHLEQARHNEDFHRSIHQVFPDSYHDWKITVLFYVALHYLRSLAISQGINIGDTHYEVEQNVNPDRPNARMRITKGAWREYKNLYHYSRSARYEGIFTDSPTFENLKKLDHSFCLQHLSNFKKYIHSRGIPLK